MKSTIDNQSSNESRGDKFARWLNDPFGSVVAATASVVGSFALLLSGIGLINMML